MFGVNQTELRIKQKSELIINKGETYSEIINNNIIN